MTDSAPVLLIAGAGRGIGAATARLAASRGYAVAVNYKSDARSAAAVVRHIEAGGGRAVAIAGDLTREADVDQVFDTIGTQLGRLTHLVFNCGITGRNGVVAEVSTETVRQVFELNVIAAFVTVRKAIPLMSTRRGGAGGAMVLVSSVAATVGGANEYVWYAASKGAIDSMAIGLSRELVPDGIRVNAVTPGVIDTDIHEPGRLARVTPMLPMGRPGQPEEVAEAIVFLLSDHASYINGANLKVSGAR